MSLFTAMFGGSQKVEELLKANPDIEVEHKGDANTMDYRVVSKNKGKQSEISLWHDINLYPTPESKSLKIVNMINEVLFKKLKS